MPTNRQRHVVVAVTGPKSQAVAVAMVVGLSVLSAAAGIAHACTESFYISAPVGAPAATIQCVGPWRQSNCHTIHPGDSPQFFYCADQTIFSMWGQWSCDIVRTPNTCTNFDDQVTGVDFCIESTDPRTVNLTWDGASGLTHDANHPACTNIEAAGFLGHTAGPGGDRDTYDLAGRPGERLRVKLDRDGAAGGTGEVATVEVKSLSGAALSQRTGRLPFTLDLTLADAGVVLEVGSAQARQGDAFRGGYILSVRPGAGKVGERLLKPRRNVEP